MPYPTPPRNFVEIRSQLFQLSDGQTDRQTDQSENITSLSGGNQQARPITIPTGGANNVCADCCMKHDLAWSVCCCVELNTSSTIPAPITSHETNDTSRNVDDLLTGFMSEPEDVPVITSAPQDVGRHSCSLYLNLKTHITLIFPIELFLCYISNINNAWHWQWYCSSVTSSSIKSWNRTVFF